MVKKSWSEMFEELGADGIDFHPIGSKLPNIKILASFTKKQFLEGVIYPRSDYTFWKNINGKKCYLYLTDCEINNIKHTINLKIPVEYVQGYLRYGQYEGEINLSEKEFNIFKENPKDFIEKNHILEELDLQVTDWNIESTGDISSVEWNEI